MKSNDWLIKGIPEKQLEEERHDALFYAHIRSAWDHFMGLSYGRFMWYAFLFVITDGWILIFLGCFWEFRKWKVQRKFKKQVKYIQDLGENA